MEALLRKQPARQIWRAEHAKQREWQGQKPGGCAMLSMSEKQIILEQPEHGSTGKWVGEAVKAMESFWKVT